MEISTTYHFVRTVDATIFQLTFRFREPEASMVCCAHLTNLYQLQIGQTFMICDADGGTVVRISLRSRFSVL